MKKERRKKDNEISMAYGALYTNMMIVFLHSLNNRHDSSLLININFV